MTRLDDPACLPSAESITVEFKSDQAKLPDRDLVEAVVCLANTDGGAIYLGVEDDGQPTGLHPDRVRLERLAAMIGNRTSPSVTVEISAIDVNGFRVARIDVPKAAQVVATSDGTYKRRRIGTNGKPECIPLLPQQIPTRLADLRALDASAEKVPGATAADFDPAERARLRQFIERYGGDVSLLSLADDELDGALGLSVREGAQRSPSLAGLLLIGKDASLRRLVPTHEVAVRLGKPLPTRWPTAIIHAWVQSTFDSRPIRSW